MRGPMVHLNHGTPQPAKFVVRPGLIQRQTTYVADIYTEQAPRFSLSLCSP